MPMILELGDFPIEHANGLGVTFNHVVWQMVRHRHLACRYWVNIDKPNNPYRETSRGPNVWDYYFQQEAPDETTTPASVEDPLKLRLSGHCAWDIAHQRAIQPLAAQYIRLLPEIQAEVDDFRARHFMGRVLAVAARATDKATEYQLMSADELLVAVRVLQERLRPDTIFLMTDSAAYHEALQPLGVCSLDIPRSELSLHHNPPRGPYWSGRWAVVDGWLAAGANWFAYTPSNMATLPLIMGRHEEIRRLNKYCDVQAFHREVDTVLGIGGGNVPS